MANPSDHGSKSSVSPGAVTERDTQRVYLLAFPANYSHANSGIDGLARLIACSWSRLLVLSLLGFVCGYALSFLASKQFRSETVVVAVDTGGTSGLLGSVLSGLGASSAISALGMGMPQNLRPEALAYLRSREFAEKSIRKYGLFEMLSRGGGFGLVSDANPHDTIEDVIDRFLKKSLAVAENRAAGTVSVSVTLPDRETAAAVASGLIRDLNEIMRSRASEEAEKSIAFLDGELQTVGSVEVKQAIYKLIEGQYKQRMIANVREDFVFRVVDPARVPDARQKISPRRSLWAVAGSLLAGVLGVIGLVVVDRRRVPADQP